MDSRDEVIRLIKDAFKANKYPGDNNIRNSDQGDEPFLLEKDFKGKKDWQYLNSEFLEQAPDGFSTALHFFSDKALRFYLPAYMIADIKNELESIDVIYTLCSNFEAGERDEKIDTRLYGDQTWADYGIEKFSSYSKPEIEAIVSYLEYKKEAIRLECLEAFGYEFEDDDVQSIDQALEFYWKKRILELSSGKQRKKRKKGKQR